jgi:hypothetical protein
MLKEELQSRHNCLVVGQINFFGLNYQQFLENYLVSYIGKIQCKELVNFPAS